PKAGVTHPAGVTPTRSPLSPSLGWALTSTWTCPACEQPISQEKLLELARNMLAQRMLNGMG
ncbi:MAG: hypothetical protein L0170_11615, partial [Acidobacteria bacterium]|nr:hypothetical protein [Acidobacteriota bacterium]